MRRQPLRRILLWGTIVLTTAALASAGLASVVVLRSYMTQQIDEQLQLAGTLARQQVDIAVDGGAPNRALLAVVAPSGYVVELRGSDTRLIRMAGPDSLPVGALLAAAPTPPAAGRVSAPATVHAGQYRAVSVRSGTDTIAIGLPLAPVRHTVRRLVVAEVTAGALVLTLLAGSLWLLLGGSLRPLEEITATASAIAAGDLDRRIAVTTEQKAGRTEVGRLALAVNRMLHHIAEAVAAKARSEQRMRDFIADASHELRTPLTSIRGYVQLLRQGVITERERPDALRRVDEEAARMAKLVADLLYLARLDAEPALRSEPVDLTAVVRDSVADALAVQPGRATELNLPERCVVRGDEDALRQVMANLLGNVRAHTPSTAAVTVCLTGGPGDARVEVTDAGPGIPAHLTDRVFARFSRADSSGVGCGLGLGLAIVAEIVAAHGGDVYLHSRPGGGTTVGFTIRNDAPPPSGRTTCIRTGPADVG